MGSVSLNSVTEAIKENKDFLYRSNDIAADITSHNIKLLTLVEELGTILTDVNPELRAKGVQLLAKVLQDLPQNFLLESELHFIVMFFCDRLKDHHTVIPATLQGISALVKMENLPKTAPQIISSTMSQHVFCQTQSQSDRFIYYLILQAFFTKWKEEFKEVAPDFVLRVISAMDGERDPRNLLLLFDMLPNFLSNFPLGNLVEDMFDVISCYFPVEFRVARDDPSAITREELSSKLQNCLVANSQFGDFCIPLLTDKLKSDLKLAKIDSLQLLIECCKRFPLSVVRPHWYELWTILRMEVLPGIDPDVRDLALEALQSVIRLFSTSPQTVQESKMLSTALNDVFSSTKSALYDVELSLFVPASKTLLAVATGSFAACQEVLTVVGPIFVEQYNIRRDSDERVIVLQSLTSFLRICQIHKLTHKSSSSSLGTIWHNIVEISFDACSNANPEVRGEGFRCLALSVRCLDDKNVNRLFECLVDSVKHEDTDLVRKEVISCLKTFSEVYADVVVENIDKLKCPFGSECEVQEVSRKICTRCIDSLCKIAVREPLIKIVIPYVLEVVTSHAADPHHCRTGIVSLRYLIESSDSANLFSYLYYDCDIVSCLLSWWFNGVTSGSYPNIFTDKDLLHNVAVVCGCIYRSQTLSEQKKLVAGFVEKFTRPESSGSGDGFSLLDHRSPPHITQLVCLLEGLLCSLRQEVEVPFFSELSTLLMDLSIFSNCSFTRTSASQLLACLVNKASLCDNLTAFLTELLSNLFGQISCNSSDSQVRNNGMELFGWLTKALVMRGHTLAEQWMEKLVILLSDECVGHTAAECFKLIMEEDEAYLNAKCYCNVRILYRQRFFYSNRKIVDAFSAAPLSVKSNYLIALAHLLQGVPRTVLTTNLAEVVPLLVESLQFREVVLLLSTLETLRQLLEFQQSGLEEHFPSLIPRFLALSHFEESMKVRIAAIKCLFQLCHYPTHVLLPFKNEVVKKLGQCLEDRKRLVRNEATTTRSRWIFIGAPGEPEKSS